MAFAAIGSIFSIYAVYFNSAINSMEAETTVERYSRYLQNFNTGVMKSLQTNPDDTDTVCAKETVKTNGLLDLMFKGSSYSTNEITQAEFLEKF